MDRSLIVGVPRKDKLALRWDRRGFLLGLVAALLLLAEGSALAGAQVTPRGDSGVRLVLSPGRYTVEEREMEGRVFRSIHLFGAGRLGEAGRPDLPVVGYWVALPDGFEARARVVAAEHDDLPGPVIEPAPEELLLPEGASVFRPARDEALYAASDWYPGGLVSVGEPARLRHQRMAPLEVRFFHVIPSTGLLRVYRRVEVEVEFVPSSGKDAAPAREPAGQEERWEGIYRGAVVNYDQGLAFRSRPVRAGASSPFRKNAALDEYKISVQEGGIYRISFSDLQAKGLAAGASIESMALYRRGFSDSLLAAGQDPFTQISLPFHVQDADGDGLFDNGEWILAYLPGFREDRMEKDIDDRYAFRSVYFLSFEGARSTFETRPGWRGFAGLAPLHSFPDSVRWEVDDFYNIDTPSDTVDLYFAVDKLVPRRVTELDLPAVDTLAPFAVKVMTVSTVPDVEYHRYLLTENSVGDTILDLYIGSEIGKLFKGERVLPGSILQTGINRFEYEGFRKLLIMSEESEGAGGFLDWYEIHADFLYRARKDYLRFSNGGERGRVQMELSGFTSPDVWVLDVTDPYRPVQLIADSVRSVGGAYSVAIQDSAGTPRAYVAATAEAAKTIPSSRIVKDAPTNLAGEEGDYLIIAYDDFTAAVEPLADFRRSRGYTVRVAAVSDVYDEFNGGVKDPLALQRYVRYGFERWSTAPMILLLVGDGFEDQKGVAGNNQYADFDYVPTYPIYQPNAELSGDHWDASDMWYVLLDGSSDFLADLLVGRLPAGDAGQVTTMVDKIVSYEDFGDDPWRNRLVFIADDAWVIQSSGQYRWGNQTQFQRNTVRFAEDLKQTAARGIDTVSVFVSGYASVFRDLCPYPGAPEDTSIADIECVVDLCHDGEGGVLEAIFSELNGGGAFLVNFQGHGNRNVLTHEVILRNGPDYLNQVSQDIRLHSDNQGRPYIFMAYGCSISEFDRFRSLGYESLTEEMVLSDRGGAVAAFASTGIEYLFPNLTLNESILKYFFQTPGVIPGVEPDTLPGWYAGIPRWRLGEAIALGMMDFVVNQRQDRRVIRRYALFGDPALELDAGTPHFDVTVEGAPVEDGALLTGRSDGGPVEIVARVHDEVGVVPESLLVFEAGEPVDTSGFTVRLDSALSTDGRSYRIDYSTQIRFGEYKIEFHAVDRNGRWGVFSLRVAVDVRVTFDGRSITPGDYVSREPALRAELTTPVPVEEEDLRFEIDGAALSIDTLQRVDEFRWLITSRPRLAGGEHTLLVGVQGLEKTYPFRVEDRFRVVDLLNFPNPSEGPTGFYYSLTDHADDVRVDVYTVSGKRIRVLRGLAGRVGYNENPGAWDGTDQDGDPVANGVYLFRLVARRGGETADAMGKAVLTR